jgi:hypothetical protein
MWNNMPILFQHEHISPYGWKGIVFVVILVFVMVMGFGLLADRKLKQLRDYKKRRPQKKGKHH